MKHHRLATALLLFACTLPFAQHSFAQDPPEEEVDVRMEVDPDTQEIEIVITVIRRSLEAAAALKRDDFRIIDAIVAEDIGKLPDNNIAEALQRVTGVAINRELGVGSDVTIRGLPQNRVELNGRSTVSGGGDGGRNGVNFQDFPADLLSVVEVIKSPTAKMIEGALGGTINLRTRRPLDLQDTLASVTVKTEYEENADNWGTLVNGSFGRNWELSSGGGFGVIASLSHMDRDLFEYQSRFKPFLNGSSTLGPQGARPFISLHELTFEPEFYSHENLAGNLSMQWQPAAGQGSFYVDYAFTDRNATNEYYSILTLPLDYSKSSDGSGGPQIADPTVANQGSYDLYTSQTERENRLINSARADFRQTDTSNVAIGGDWDVTDRISISGEMVVAQSETFEPYYDLRFYSMDPAGEDANPAARNYNLLTTRLNYNSGAEPDLLIAEGQETLTNPEFWTLRRYQTTEDFADNNETAYRFDTVFRDPFSGGLITAIETGLRFTQRDFEFSRDAFTSRGWETLDDADGNPIPTINLQDVANAGHGDVLRSFNFDYFPGGGSNDFGRFVLWNGKQLYNPEQTIAILAQMFAGTEWEGDFANPRLDFSPGDYYAIQEDTAAAYLQVNIDAEEYGVPLAAVAGVRYVTTDLGADGYVQVGGRFESSVTTFESDYADVLPSLNLTYSVRENTLVRFAAAKVIRRADFNELAPSYEVDVDFTQVQRGNPFLDPYRATQYDLSVEHYFGGNMASAAVFYKNVESFLTVDQACLDAPEFVALTQDTVISSLCFLDGAAGSPDAGTSRSLLGLVESFETNGEDGKVQGFELAYQHSFTTGFLDGFGASLNYTYADSEDPDGVPLLDISKNTINAIVFYENEKFSTRLAYTRRDRFFENTNEGRTRYIPVDLTRMDPVLRVLGIRDSYREDITRLDWSASYQVNDNFRVQADVVNLMEEPVFDSDVQGTIHTIRQADRRFTIGVNYKF